MERDSRTEAAVAQLLALWESGDLPAKVEMSVIRRRVGTRPADAWSFGNQLLMLINGTTDARGFRQWQEVGRTVKKGAKAFYIFGPKTRKVEGTNAETGQPETQIVITGFRNIPVFAIEDTEGEPVVEPDYDPVELPPLMEVATSWGIDVSYAPFSGSDAGFYVPGFAKIVLKTHEASVFFHELAHAADDRISPLKGGQVAADEIVAETVAAALALVYGFDLGKQTSARAYVAQYAGMPTDQASKAVMQCLSRIQAVLDLILTTAADFGRRDYPSTLAA